MKSWEKLSSRVARGCILLGTRGAQNGNPRRGFGFALGGNSNENLWANHHDCIDIRALGGQCASRRVRGPAGTSLTNPPPGVKPVQVQVDTTDQIEPHTPGAASRGEITQPIKVAGTVEEQRSAATKKLGIPTGRKYRRLYRPSESGWPYVLPRHILCSYWKVTSAEFTMILQK